MADSERTFGTLFIIFVQFSTLIFICRPAFNLFISTLSDESMTEALFHAGYTGQLAVSAFGVEDSYVLHPGQTYVNNGLFPGKCTSKLWGGHSE